MESPAWMFTKALSHRQKVCRLYKRALREVDNWYGGNKWVFFNIYYVANYFFSTGSTFGSVILPYHWEWGVKNHCTLNISITMHCPCRDGKSWAEYGSGETSVHEMNMSLLSQPEVDYIRLSFSGRKSCHAFDNMQQMNNLPLSSYQRTKRMLPYRQGHELFHKIEWAHVSCGRCSCGN